MTSEGYEGNERYLDLVDTVRTRSSRQLTLAKASVFTSILTAERLVLSQAQSFDSRVVIDAVSGSDHEAGAFMRLAHDGAFEFRLYKAESIWSAFLAALERRANPPRGQLGFEFSAWPELNEQ